MLTAFLNDAELVKYALVCAIGISILGIITIFERWCRKNGKETWICEEDGTDD